MARIEALHFRNKGVIKMRKKIRDLKDFIFYEDEEMDIKNILFYYVLVPLATIYIIVNEFNRFWG